VVLPCLDEAEALPWVLERVPSGWRAIVVDNGSTDGSADVARSLGATVVREERRGFGAACHAGLVAATADVVCFCDCDASLDPSRLVPFVNEVLSGDADLVLGRRRPQTLRAWPAHARAGNLALALMLRRRTGLRLHDLGPLRAARRTALLGLGLTDRRSGYPLQMVVRAADAGWKIAEHDVPYLPRTGASKVTGTWRGTWHAVRDMSRVLAEPPSAATAVADRGVTARPAARPAAPASAGPAARPAARGTGVHS
jgi:glycosyltransferase involved in cell wall biosynthesis